MITHSNFETATVDVELCWMNDVKPVPRYIITLLKVNTCSKLHNSQACIPSGVGCNRWESIARRIEYRGQRSSSNNI